MNRKQWEKLKAFLEENGIEYELKCVFMYKGISQYQVYLPTVQFGGAEDA